MASLIDSSAIDTDTNKKVNKFGSVSGLIDKTKVLSIELSNDQPKTITVIDASFRVALNSSRTLNPFVYSAVAVFRGTVEDYPLSTVLSQLERSQNLEYLRFFDQYGGINANCYIQAGQNEKLSVVLFSPYLESDLAEQSEAYGSLNVFGSFAQQKALFEVAS